jgi:four helix bundle protein
VKAKSFKDLIVWQKAYRLVLEIYKLTDLFPKHEIYGLAQQIRRTAVSIPSIFPRGMAGNTIKNIVSFYLSHTVLCVNWKPNIF